MHCRVRVTAYTIGVVFSLLPLLWAQAPADDSWAGKDIMTKAGGREIHSGENVIGKTRSVVLRVLEEEGYWLRVRDYGTEGWLARSDVVLLEKGVEYFTQEIGKNPREGWLYQWRGVAFRQKGDHDAAIRDYTEAIRLNPNDPNAYANRADGWYEKKDYDKAIEDYSEAIRLDPADRYAYRFRADTWSEMKKLDNAIADYNEAIRLDPNDFGAYNGRGRAWVDKGEYDEAIADFSEAIRLEPTNGLAWHNRGYALGQNGDYDKAIADNGEAIRLNPKHRPSYYNRGIDWQAKNEHDKAIADFNEAIRLDPNFNPAYYHRGLSWNRKEEYDKAISDFSEAIRLAPQDAESFAGRGSAWRNKKEYEKALADFNEAIRFDSKNAQAYNGRAWLWATCADDRYRDGRQAVESARHACELTDSAQPEYLDTLAAAYAESGAFDKAVEQQARAIDLAADEDKPEYKSRLALFQKRKPYREGEAARDVTVATVVKGNTDFAFDLYRQLKENEGNLFFSPYSISTALAMTYGGAAGDTQAEMARVLHFPAEQEPLHAVFASLVRQLQSPGIKRPYQLHVANALWAQEDYQFSPAYFSLVEDRYRAALKDVNFARDPEEVRQAINRWVSRQTSGKIKDLLSPRDVDEGTRFVLTNAIYFKAAWKERFNKNLTMAEDFFTAAQAKHQVPMMHQNELFRYMDGGNFQLLELPYTDGELSMLVLLPKEVDGLEEVERSLSATALEKWSKAMEEYDVDVSLPKFTTTARFELPKTLASMGMKLPFDRDRADFSEMTGRRELYIANVIHQAFVEVDEEGTEAAAATAVIGAPGAGVAPKRKHAAFRADHPFVYLIREKATGSILFAGRVVSP